MITLALPDARPLSPPQIGVEYAAGRMLTSEVKDILIKTLVPMVQEMQASKAKVTDEMVARFMAVRPLDMGKRRTVG